MFDNDPTLAPFAATTAADRFSARLTLAELELATLPAETLDLITAVAAARAGQDAFMVSARLALDHGVQVLPYTVDLHLTLHRNADTEDGPR